jgi:hypothetical protein
MLYIVLDYGYITYQTDSLEGAKAFLVIARNKYKPKFQSNVVLYECKVVNP